MTDYISMKFGPAKRKRRGFYYICETCSREFYASPTRVRETESKGIRIRFCSIACYAKAKTGDGNPFWGKKHSPESVKKMLANPNRRKFIKGKDNPNGERFGILPSPKSSAKRWRLYLLKKRGEKCETCGFGKYPGVIELHHIDNNSKNQSEDNFLLLCPTCHEVVHYLSGTGKYGKSANGTSHGAPNPHLK